MTHVTTSVNLTVMRVGLSIPDLPAEEKPSVCFSGKSPYSAQRQSKERHITEKNGAAKVALHETVK
jgi:hypothetical protein